MSGVPGGPPSGVRGSGTLLDALTLDLTEPPPGSVVLVRDGWDPDRDAREQAELLAGGMDLLPVRLVSSSVIVGPRVRAGEPGCQVCAMRRRRLWNVQRGPRTAFGAAEAPGQVPLTALTHVLAVMRRSLAGDPILDRGTYVVSSGLDADLHRFLPVATCPGCSVTPTDSAALARVELQPRPQAAPEAFRTNPRGLAGSEWRRRIVDWRYGPVGHVFRADNSAGALFCAELALSHGGKGEGGYGRAASYPEAETIALYEAAERLESATPARTRTAVYAAEADLPEAVPFAAFGLHQPDAPGKPLFRMEEYSPQVPTDWVWAWSLARDSAVLIPEQIAYWAIDGWGREGGVGPRFLYESSNGAAIGSTVEEAILYGLFEVIERDAFLLTWYTRRPARRLAVGPEISDVESMRHSLAGLGYRLHFFDITSELDVPTVLSLVVRDDDRGPVAFFAAGAHCDPVRAVTAAAHEAVTNATVRARTDADKRRADDEHARELLADFDRVDTLHDHTGLYNIPETRPFWEFLRTTGPAVPLDQAFAGWRERWVRTDLTDVLREVLGVVERAGLDVLVVNQTDPALGPDHATVKVVVPGTIPMTFGHVHRRVRGLQRLASVPLLLGYRGPEEVTADVDDIPPHPFP